jgi:hypothetical protein
MAGSFSVTISNLSGLGATKRAESSEIAAAVNDGIRQLVSAHATSITLKDRNGNTLGTMSWSPVATS